MELEYYKVQKQDRRPTVCPHNEACRCIVKNCISLWMVPKGG